jgi:hypothetical protein
MLRGKRDAEQSVFEEEEPRIVTRRAPNRVTTRHDPS